MGQQITQTDQRNEATSDAFQQMKNPVGKSDLQLHVDKSSSI